MGEKDEASVLDEEDCDEASVLRFVNQIIREALRQKATDIHIEPQHDILRIRYRVDGHLMDVPVPERINALQSSVIARLKIMSRLDAAERRVPQDGRINLKLEGKSIDVRVVTIPAVEGETISLRILNQEKFSLDQHPCQPAASQMYQHLLHKSHPTQFLISAAQSSPIEFRMAIGDSTPGELPLIMGHSMPKQFHPHSKPLEPHGI